MSPEGPGKVFLPFPGWIRALPRPQTAARGHFQLRQQLKGMELCLAKGFANISLLQPKIFSVLVSRAPERDFLGMLKRSGGNSSHGFGDVTNSDSTQVMLG